MRKIGIRIKAICCLICVSVLLAGCSYGDLLRGLYGINSSGEESRQSERGSVWDRGSSLWGEDLTFDEFLEELFLESATSDTLTLHFYFAAPEEYGITPGPVSWGGFGYEDKKESRKAIGECRQLLQQYRNDGLNEEQQITADILENYLDNCEADIDLDYYYEPFRMGNGLQSSLPLTMAEYAFYDSQDVEDYLTLLSRIGDYFEAAIAWEREKADEGLFMTDELLDRVLEECDTFLWDGEDEFFLHETFKERLGTLVTLTEAEKDSYISRDKQILTNDFYNAYIKLRDGLESLRGKGNNDKGICYFPKGREYYEYLINSNIGMTYSNVDALFDALLTEVEYIYDSFYTLISEDEEIYEQWGLEPEDNRPSEEMLNDLKDRIKEDFPEGPDNTFQVKKVAESMEDFLNPAFYMIPPIDRYDENVIYINEGELVEGYNLYSVLAHEGYPGHLYQTTYFAGQDTSNFRKMLNYTGYAEGWGSYAEYYSYKWMDNMSQGLQALNCLTSRLNSVVSAILDMGINYYGWTREDAVGYSYDLTGIESEDIIEEMYPYIINDPAGYLDYYVGYMEIRNMADEARLALGNDYEAKEFHRFLLDFGPAPFHIIKRYFDDWLKNFSFEKKFPEIDYQPMIAHR